MSDTTTGLPVSTSTDGDVVVGVEAGAVIGLDTAANIVKLDASNNTVKLDQTSSNNKVQFSQTAGQNSVDIDSINGTAITTANLPTDLATIAGTAPPVPGKIAIDGVNSTPLPVTVSGTAGTEKTGRVGPTNVAANLGTATINFADITAATTGHLLRIEFFSQTQMRCEIQKFDGTTATTVSDSGTPAGGGPGAWQAPSDNFITQAGGTGKHFRIIFTNLDKNKAADIYATAFWTEI